MGPDGPAEVTRDEDGPEKRRAWNQKQKGDCDLNDAQNRRKLRGDAEVVEHRLLARPIHELRNAAGSDHEEANQSSENPAGDAFRFGGHVVSQLRKRGMVMSQAT